MTDGATGLKPLAIAHATHAAQSTTGTKAMTVSASKPQTDKRAVSRESAAQFLALLNDMPAGHLYSSLLPQGSSHGADSAAASTVETASRTEELTALLQRYCSDLYVDTQSSTNSPRMLLMLDTALPGAAAELVREGVFLRVRLHAWNDAAFRVMSAQRHSLNTALGDTTPLNVVVEVIRDEGRHDGSDR